MMVCRRRVAREDVREREATLHTRHATVTRAVVTAERGQSRAVDTVDSASAECGQDEDWVEGGHGVVVRTSDGDGGGLGENIRRSSGRLGEKIRRNSG